MRIRLIGVVCLGVFYALIAGGSNFVGKIIAQPKPPEPMKIAESKPVTVNDAKFVVVAETEWRPKLGQHLRVEIQLRITNDAKVDTVFHTFDTFGIRLFDSSGKQLKVGGGRNVTRFTKPFLLSAGASYTVAREAFILWEPKAKAAELIYRDGTGSEWSFGPLPAGNYKLNMWYGVSPKAQPKIENDGAGPRWVGGAISGDLLVRVVEP